jgi:serine/threonine-protein kinase HipA
VNESLVLVADGQVMGEIVRDGRGRLTLVYDTAWRAHAGAWPLSLSMPLVVETHEHSRIEPWLRGLLPDNDMTLERWGQRFRVSPRDTFALLAIVGEDCAGAVQFVRPDRAGALIDGKPMTVDWVTRTDMADRLRNLRKDSAAWRAMRDTGQTSLAGARPKTALFYNGQHWGVPSGRTPTTHILKPSADLADGHAQNEHFCLALARSLGLPAARTQVLRLEDQTAVVVERYDRARENGTTRRLHQESLRQALGPASMATGRAGRAVARMIELVRTHSGDPAGDAWTLARALMFGWLIGARPARPEDFSILIGAGGRARLAPIHAMASTLLPQAEATATETNAPEQGAVALWTRFAMAARLPVAQVLAACRDMAQTMPDAMRAAALQGRSEGVDHPALAALLPILVARVDRCAQALAG